MRIEQVAQDGLRGGELDELDRTGRGDTEERHPARVEHELGGLDRRAEAVARGIGHSEAYRSMHASPASRAAAWAAAIIPDRTPRRRWVGWTVTALTADAASRAPPGTVSSVSHVRKQPTSRSSSAAVQTRSRSQYSATNAACWRRVGVFEEGRVHSTASARAARRERGGGCGCSLMRTIATAGLGGVPSRCSTSLAVHSPACLLTESLRIVFIASLCMHGRRCREVAPPIGHAITVPASRVGRVRRHCVNRIVALVQAVLDRRLAIC